MGRIRSIGALILMAFAAAGVTGPLKQFYDSRQWFDLLVSRSARMRALLYPPVLKEFHGPTWPGKYPDLAPVGQRKAEAWSSAKNPKCIDRVNRWNPEAFANESVGTPRAASPAMRNRESIPDRTSLTRL
jgi:hypothetical protein